MKVKCPTCQQAVEWSSDSEFRPFCSKKCQLIDLGEWADEEKVISSPAQEAEIHNLDPEDIEAMLSEQHSDFFKH
ncbi:DNA gyrase inhibitor YacG [uncultured Alteromonas sp.]|uniref:DNA gyrase inhibitor YacG n=1 Tax=uncultured Alteromonas sp. TaxID=179113 RepID=UPI0025EB0F00|nr:DNA gyrase inhibitor YacG [uncultured Alteromonas sp.]